MQASRCPSAYQQPAKLYARDHKTLIRKMSVTLCFLLASASSTNVAWRSLLAVDVLSFSGAMEQSAAIDYLRSLLNKKLHIHTSDSRMFVGDFKCTDNVCQDLT